MSFENNLIEKIYDNIHGFVYLTKAEKELLSHPYLHRLHFIKQNALANFIFPGATHTRFSHSIGVLYISEKIIQRLKKINKIDINDVDHQVVRLAALLHDIGHYPLSHTLETSYKHYGNIIKRSPNQLTQETPINYADIFTSSDLTIKNLFQDLDNKRNEFHHEEISKLIIEETCLRDEIEFILKTINPDISDIDLNSYIKIIGEMIIGKVDYTEVFFQNNNSNINKYSILSKIINSNLDADQMDYMMRDTVSTGIEYTIRLDFIIDNINICLKNFTLPDNETIKTYVLCFNNKALAAIEQFLLSKSYWYSEIIYYNKVHILNLIAQRLSIFMLFSKNKPYSNEYDTYDKLFELAKKPEEYFFFNDNFFWEKIQKCYIEQNIPPLIKSICKRLVTKQIPKILNFKKFKDIVGTNNKQINYSTMLCGTGRKRTQANKGFIINTYKKGINYLPVCIQQRIFDPKNSEDFTSDRSINITNCHENECSDCSQETMYAKNIGFGDLSKNFLTQFYDIKQDIYKDIFKYIIFDFS